MTFRNIQFILRFFPEGSEIFTVKIAGSGSPRLSDVQHPRLRKRSSMASALAASMLSGLKSGIKAHPKAGGGSGVFSRSRNLMLRSIRILGTFASVKY